MEIAIVRRGDIMNIDGVNRFIAYLAEGLTRLSHKPVVVSRCRANTERKLEEWFAEFHGLDIKVPVITLRQTPCKGDPWLNIAWDWYTKGSKILKKEGVDAAIVNDIIPLRLRPKIAVNHGIATLKMSRYYIIAAKWLYRSYDRVVCVSNKLREEVRRTLGVDCVVVPLPLKLENYKPAPLDERENVIVHIGTSPVKNPHISIEAVRILRKRGLPVRLVIVGPPANLPIDDFVGVRFSLSEKKTVELLCRAKALILPSAYEAFPYATLEAMACGTPPVVSSAVPEEAVADGFNGVRVGNYDARDYADALERLLRDEELLGRLSENGRKFVRQFDHIRVASTYVELIRQLHER